jgi:hypothetical protein
MKEQNYKNHTRYVLAYHGVTFLGILALLIGSFVNLFSSSKDNLYSASLICLIAGILSILFWYIRSFALRVQDRAIRAEENFRHFILTGKPFPADLTMGQIVALRFASDEEFAALVKSAVSDKLPGKAIKEAIRNWRADHYRA